MRVIDLHRDQATSRAPFEKAQPVLKSAGFFVFRTPLLPIGEYQALAENPRTNVLRLLAVPEVKEALFLASPDLIDALPRYQTEPDSERGQKVEQSLLKYLFRMSMRPTPFGLFAGCSVGRVGAQTQLVLQERASYRRHARLDGAWAAALYEHLARLPEVEPRLKLLPNSTLHTQGATVRYIEQRRDEQGRISHFLVSVRQTEYLTYALERAAEGTSVTELLRALCTQFPSLSEEQAAEYIRDLLRNQILLSNLCLPATGRDALTEAQEQLAGMSCPNAGAAVGEVCALLASLSRDGLGIPATRYEELAERASPLLAWQPKSPVVQADLFKPTARAELAEGVLSEVAQATLLLHRLCAEEPSKELREFRERFVKRFDGREVPLLVALDEEAGIPYGPVPETGAEATLLLGELGLKLSPPPPAESVSPRDAFLLRKLTQALLAGEREVEIREYELQALKLPTTAKVPPALSILGALCGTPDSLAKGEWCFRYDCAWGPSGASLLGRFCDGDSELRAQVEELVRKEQELLPDAVLAEIVHLPGGRIGNVALRPVLRSHEICFLGHSGAPRERQLDVSDLTLQVVGDLLVLRSQRLGKQIIPRLTNAHNFRHPKNLALYRFLCDLQSQQSWHMLQFHWGRLAAVELLPRVRTGRVILAPLQWRPASAFLLSLRALPEEAARSTLRERAAHLGLPRHLLLADGDNRLPIDLQSEVCCHVLLDLLRSRTDVIFEEALPQPAEHPVTGPEGAFAQELILPLLSIPAGPAASAPPALASTIRTYPPGSEWLFAKIYCGPAQIDRLLVEVVAPLVKELPEGSCKQWFFIRYKDPDWHLRLRFRGPRSRLWGELLPSLQDRLSPYLSSGVVQSMTLDTYRPEFERYGGPDGLRFAEQLFQIDSETSLELIPQLIGDGTAAWRWKVVLCGLAFLLDDLCPEPAAQLATLARMQKGYRNEFALGKEQERPLGARYRRERETLEQLVGASLREDLNTHPAVLSYRNRRTRLAPVLRELRHAESEGKLHIPIADLAGSYLHMHAIRMLRTAIRAQELVLYDYLFRLYTSRQVRSSQTPESGT